MRIRCSDADRPSIYDRLERLVAWPWRYRKLNTARWLVLGQGSKLLVLSRLLGLDRIVAMGRSAPGASDYWLHHFAALHDHLHRVLAGIAVGSWLPDKLCSAIMKDPRVARQAVTLSAVMAEQQQILHGIPSHVWVRLTSTVEAEIAGTELRHIAVSVATTCAAWFQVNVLDVASAAPWKYACGDVRSHARAIRQLPPEGLDPVTAKIRGAMVDGAATEADVASVLLLLGEAPWSTLDVEQQHGSLAVQHRFHRDLSSEHLALRGYLHSIRALFTPSPESVAISRLQRQLDRTQKINYNKSRSYGAFLSDVTQIIKATVAGAAHRDVQFWNAQNQSTGARWHALSHAERMRYAEVAQLRRESRWAELHSQQDTLSAAILLLRDRQRTAHQFGPLNHVGAHRLSDVHLSLIASDFASLADSHLAVSQLCTTNMHSPVEIDEITMASLAEHVAHKVSIGRCGKAPSWLAAVRDHRDSFGSTALVRMDLFTGVVYECWLFLVALQNPRCGLFQEALHQLSPGFTEASGADEAHRPSGSWPHTLYALPGAFASDLDLQIDLDTEDWFVIPHICRASGDFCIGVHQAVPWQVFACMASGDGNQQAADGEGPPSSEPAARRRPAPLADLPEWARQWFSSTEPSGASSGGAAGSAGPAAPKLLTPVTAEEEDRIELELSQMRAWLSEQYPFIDEHFAIRVLGGLMDRRAPRCSMGCLAGICTNWRRS